MSDENSQDFYSYRLAEVDKNNAVVARQDILNQQGAKILAKGDRLSRSKAEQIVRHKLAVPIEHCIDIENSLDGEALYKTLAKFIGTLPGLDSIAHGKEIHSPLKRLCMRYEKFPLIRQKLTVLEDQLPEVYYRSLFSAIASVAIAMKMRLPERDEEVVFLGGLMHNTGYLHLDPDTVSEDIETKESVNPNIQVHPKIAKIFLDSIPGLPKTVGEAVEDHHERTDGTGYPMHKFGKALNVESQIIAMTDLVISSYARCGVYGDHAHQLVRLILHLNDNVHFQEVYKATATLIQRGARAPTGPVPTPPSPQALLGQQKRIMTLFDAEKKIAFVLMKNVNATMIRSIAAMIGRLASSINSSGMAQPEYTDWLKELTNQADTSEDHFELLKSLIMQNEIEDQLLRLRGMLGKLIGVIPETQESLKQSVELSYSQIANL